MPTHYATIADAGKGIRAGQKAAWGDKPCHGEVWHIFDQCEALCRNLTKKAQGATSQPEKLEKRMEEAKLQGKGNKLSHRSLGLWTKKKLYLRKIYANKVRGNISPVSARRKAEKWLRKRVKE